MALEVEKNHNARLRGDNLRECRHDDMSSVGKSMRAAKYVTIVLLLLAIGSSGISMVADAAGARSLFRELVVSPIPESMREIRADRCQIARLKARLHGSHEVAYVLRFKINREDVARIVAARGFTVCRSPKYSKGELSCDLPDHVWTDVKLYNVRRRAPRWFDLGEWTECETYRTGVDMWPVGKLDLSYLIYNEQRGSAYLIKWEKQR